MRRNENSKSLSRQRQLNPCKWIKTLAKYALVSLSATLIDFILLWFFTDIAGLHYLISGAIAYLASNSYGYSTNRFWTFKARERKFIEGYLFYLSIGLIGLGITLILLNVFVESIGINYLVAKLITALIVWLWNYIMNLRFTFRQI